LSFACGSEASDPSTDKADLGAESDDDEGEEPRKTGKSDAGGKKDPEKDSSVAKKDAGTKVAAPPAIATPATSDGGVVEKSGGEWCKVKPVFEKHCTSCHDGEGTAGAPKDVALLTHADWKKTSPGFPDKKIFERAGVRMKASQKPMPPTGGVSAEEQALVDAWIAAGAPGSDGDTCATGEEKAPEAAWPPADCEEKHQLRANDGKGGKFVARKGQYYQDFMFTPPWKGDLQAVGFRAIVDNKSVLHHYIVYQNNAFLVGWSPGKNDHVMPSDIGVFMPASGQLKMTVHYYNEDGTGQEQDESGVEVCLTKKPRPKTAAVMPFAANPVVPAGANKLEIKSTCTVQAKEPVTIITSSPHMHGLGVGAKFSVQRANGQTEVMHDKPFNFEEQTTYGINTTVNNGDRITTTCVYSNSTNARVSFGTNTEDEMCFNFALYYPMCAMTCVPDDPLAAVYPLSQGGGCPAPGGAGAAPGGAGGAGRGGLGGLLGL
jgi:cytochrome c5